MPMDSYTGGDTSPHPYSHENPRPVPPLHLSIESLNNYADDCETASGGIPPAPLPPTGTSQVPSIHIQPESDEKRPLRAPRKQ